MPIQDFFDYPIAYDPASNELIGGAVFTVYAEDDVSFATPLTVTDPVSGVVISPLTSSPAGVLPAFRVAGDPPQVLIKSGSFATRLASRYGVLVDAGYDPDQVAAAIAAVPATMTARDAALAAQAAAEAVPTSNDTIIAGRINTPGSATRTALDTTIGSVAGAPVNVKTLGIQGDGTNERVLLQSIIGSGGRFLIPQGCVIDIDGGALNLSTSVETHIRMEPGAAIRQSGNYAILSQNGLAGVGTAVAITAGSTAGSSVITAATLTAAVGDWVRVQSEDLVHPDDTVKRAYLRQVLAVSGSNFSLDAPLPRDLTTTPMVAPVTLAKRVRIDGGRFYHSNPSAQGVGSVVLAYSLNPTLLGVEFGPLGGEALKIDSCVGGEVDGYFHDILDGGNTQPGPIVHYGHGVLVSGAARGFKARGFATRLRHAFTTEKGGTLYGEPEGCEVQRAFVAQNTYNTAFDTHEHGVGTILDGVAINCPVGFSDRAYKTVISGIALGCGAFAGTTSTYGCGVKIVGASRNALVTATIQNTDTTALAHIHVASGSTGAVIGGVSDEPPAAIPGILANAVYTSIGPGVKGVRSGAVTYEIQGSYPSLNVEAPSGTSAAIAWKQDAGKKFDLNKQTSGDFLEMRSYETDGTTVRRSVVLFGRSRGETRLGGTLVYARRAVTSSPVTIATTDSVVAITTASGAFTVNLPATDSFAAGELILLGEASGAQTATVVPSGSNTFADGTTSKTFATNGGSLRLISNGAAGASGRWSVV